MKLPRRSALLIVAPETDLRHSLAFLLEAEGYAVATAGAWMPEFDSDVFDGVILDEGALKRSFREDGTLRRFGNRIVLLAGRPGAPPDLPPATVLRKPLLEGVLVETLDKLLASPT